MASTPATASEFLDLVRKSAVVEEKRLDAQVQKLRAAGQLPPEPSKLAGILVRDGLLTHFQAEQLMQGNWRGFTIGKYKVLESLGSGGMGRVYLCEHKLMRRRVAVKILPPSKANEPAVLERFYREARAAAAVDHPNVVHAYDIDQDGKYHFLVMEYVDGSSLQEIVKKTGPMQVGRAAHYIRQAALGMEHAHSMGLVHRDIKPGNILVDRNGVVKLLDMGLARFFHDDEDILTKKYDESVLGTADYLAPEQAVDSHAVDIRADIYSLGATFYFVLVGTPPFGDATVAQKLLWHQTRQPKSVATLRKDVPAELAALIQKMMAKEPADRFQTPAAVAEVLSPWTQGAIALPSEKEMPQLSPAASGSSGEPTVISAASAGPTTPAVAGSERTWPSNGPATPPASPKTPAATVPPLPAAALSNSQSGVAVAAEDESEAELQEEVAWEHLTADTEDLAAKADTAPGSRRRVIPAVEAKARAKEQRNLRRIFIAVSLVGFVVLGVLIWLFFFNPRTAPGVRPRLVVARGQANKPFHYASVKRALEEAVPGDVIELHDPVHEESLLVGQPNAPITRGVTIQAAAGANVVWRAKYKNEKQPVVVVSNVVSLTIKDIAFDGAIDGKRKLETLMRISSECPGLVLENLEFRNFSQTGLTVVNCVGEPDLPVKLINLRAAASPDPNKAPFCFDANPQMRPQQNNFIEIEGIDPTLLRRKNNNVNGPNISWPAAVK